MKRSVKPTTIVEKVSKKVAILLGVLFFLPLLVHAQDEIIIQKTERIDLKGIKQIHVYNLKGMNVKVKNNSLNGYKVFIKADESALLRNFGGGRVYTEAKDDILEVYFKVGDSEGSNSSKTTWIKSLFTQSHVTMREVKEAVLELDIPKGLDIKVTARYSTMEFEPIDGNLEITNRSGSVDVHGSTKSVVIRNDYGKVKAENIQGNAQISSRSSESTLTDIGGTLEVESNYSTLRIERVKGTVSVENKSGSVKVEDLSGDYNHRGDYTSIKLKGVAGTAIISNKSGSLEFEDIGGLQFKGGYTSIIGDNITSRNLVTIDTRSSTVKIKHVNGSVSIDGSFIKLSLSDLAEDLKVYNRSGSVDVSDIKGKVRIDGEFNQIDVDGFTGTYFEVDNRSGSIRASLDGSKLEKISIKNRHDNLSLTLKNTTISRGSIQVSRGSIKAESFKDLIKRETKNDTEHRLVLEGSGKTEIDIDVENANVVID